MSTLLLLLILLVGCAAPGDTGQGTGTADKAMDEERGDQQDPHLPDLTRADLDDHEELQVVASTNIVADVVSQVGGDQIDLIGLMPAGVDPHGFEPTPQDLIALNDAHVIFVNGLGLEESLDAILDSLDGHGAVVSVNAGVEILDFGGEHSSEGHVHTGPDPHTWFSIRAIRTWVENVERVLSDLDPAGAEVYSANAEAYFAELDALAAEMDERMTELPLEKRRLVTDHDSLGYFAAAYGFDVIGTVIPGLSTMASPSASQLAALHDQIDAENVKAVFVSTTVNSAVAEQLAADAGVEVVGIYTGSLSDADGPAGSYLDLMRHDMATIVNALR